jgi:(4S)-4-hydroxy-5-phosphonooxypentane-2,3-dione isomerase
MGELSTDVTGGAANRPAKRYAITVSFRVLDGDRAKFLKLVRANAAASVELEPGCRRFDVLVPLSEASGDILLYEIYDDREAFEAHLTSDHFAAFDSETRAMVASKTIVEFETIENAKI